MNPEIENCTFVAIADWQPLENGRFRPIARIAPRLVSEQLACDRLSLDPEQLRKKLKPLRITPRQYFYPAQGVADLERGKS